jgi:general secretion pathway protein A
VRGFVIFSRDFDGPLPGNALHLRFGHNAGFATCIMSMYLGYFALREAPFSIAPDPRYLYMSQQHKEALAHLSYGLSGSGGFVVLSGEVGAGKTTVCRCLLEQIPPECDLAYVFNPKLTAVELLATLCSEFHVELPPGTNSVKTLVDAINVFLLDGHAKGRHAVLIIDEAQNLSADVLEQMRLLTNLETSRRKLLQIILVGQPELDQMLARQELRQLAQRVIARYHLNAMSKTDVGAYIAHRLQVAGGRPKLIPPELAGLIHSLTAGVPRLVNLLCDRALLGAYVEGKLAVNATIVKRAAREVLPGQRAPRLPGRVAAGIAILSSALVGVLSWQLLESKAPVLKPKTNTQAAVPTVRQPPALTATKANGVAKRTSEMPAQPTQPAAPTHLTPPPAGEDSLDFAFTSLYQAWGEPLPAAGRCPNVARLRCRTSHTSVQELRQFDRPAILYLTDEQGKSFAGVLTHLAGDRATLAIGNSRQVVALTALSSYWSGRYTLLWRAPSYLPDQFRNKDSGPAVAWLARQVALANGMAQSKPPRQIDESLRGAIRRFQFEHNLPPDGQIGAQTLIRLSAYGDSQAPRLSQGES